LKPLAISPGCLFSSLQSIPASGIDPQGLSHADSGKPADDGQRQLGISFSMHVGLHSGEVVEGKSGDDPRMDCSAQGLTVGPAQRIEPLASPNTCYL
jgi:class 3 adenylate cyclase